MTEHKKQIMRSDENHLKEWRCDAKTGAARIAMDNQKSYCTLVQSRHAHIDRDAIKTKSYR